MRLFYLLRELLLFDFDREQEIMVRIVIRDKNNLITKHKYIPIQGILLPSRKCYGININQTDIDETPWEEI